MEEEAVKLERCELRLDCEGPWPPCLCRQCGAERGKYFVKTNETGVPMYTMFCRICTEAIVQLDDYGFPKVFVTGTIKGIGLP